MADVGGDRARSAQGLAYCLLYDLCGWLTGDGGPVAVGAGQYARSDLRAVAGPRRRLEAYVGPRLLEAWEAALAPFFEAGYRLEPLLEAGGPPETDDPGPGRPVLARLPFANGSSVRDAEGRVHPAPGRSWVLNVWLAPELDRVETASLVGPPET